MGELKGDDRICRIDIKGLSDDVRREIVKRVKDKLGYSGALEALGIARDLYSTIYTKLEKSLTMLFGGLCTI
ncbi:MAG: hypothetical protein RQ885_07325 [Desulfurococcales archaeon]|jgi:hypothetical protein|nr:hypothetical protein [Desulfurococcales archaeon]